MLTYTVYPVSQYVMLNLAIDAGKAETQGYCYLYIKKQVAVVLCIVIEQQWI
jgi:hypothetical protein